MANETKFGKIYANEVTVTGNLVTSAITVVDTSTVTNAFTFASTTTFNGPATFASTAIHNGALTVNSTSTFNGPATFASTTTFNGPATFATQVTMGTNLTVQGVAPLTTSSAGTPGQLIVQSSASFLYVCIASNSWARVALSATTGFN